MHETKVNREHKSSMFSHLFSDPAVLRELYSAIEGVEIPPDTPIVINTLSNVLFMGYVNDLSFTIDNKLVVLIEHQSTINENMPLRLLMYIGRIYEQITSFDDKYNERLMPIPRPEFIVLYNGTDYMPDYKEYKLSDAFKDAEGLKRNENEPLPLELIVKVYNINSGHNKDILEKSTTLDGYSHFIDKIRYFQNNENLPRNEAGKKAVNFCIKHDILSEYLSKHGSEVINMIFGEWDNEKAIEVACRETRREEREYVLNLVAQGLTADEIKQRLEQENTARRL